MPKKSILNQVDQTRRECHYFSPAAGWMQHFPSFRGREQTFGQDILPLDNTREA